MKYLCVALTDDEPKFLLLDIVNGLTTFGYTSAHDNQRWWQSLNNATSLDFTGKSNNNFIWREDTQPIKFTLYQLENPDFIFIKSPKFPLQTHYPELFL